MRLRILLALLCGILAAICAAPAWAQCDVTNSAPVFPKPGGSAFGLQAPQWSTFLGSKADANNGHLCGPTITDLPNPVNPGDAVNLATLDASLVNPNTPHKPVAVATGDASGPIPLPNSPIYVNGSGPPFASTLTSSTDTPLIVDGVTVGVVGTRVLVDQEPNPAWNGIYVLSAVGIAGTSPWVLTRAADFDQATVGGIALGATVLVELSGGGATQGGTTWVMSTSGPIIVGTTPINWVNTAQSVPLSSVSTACPSIITYGGDSTGTNYSDAAYTAAIAAQPGPSACIYLPHTFSGAGHYKFQNPVSYTFPSSTSALTIVGDGSGASFIDVPSSTTYGLHIVKSACNNSVVLRGFSVTTGAAAGGTGISTTGACTNGTYQPVNLIEDVVTRGDDFNGSSGTDYWATGLSIVNDSWYNVIGYTDQGPGTGFAGASSGGTCVNVAGTSSAIAVAANFYGLTCNLVSTGLGYGNYVQGVNVIHGNFTGCYNGIVVPSGAAEQSQLHVSDSQFACANSAFLDQTGVLDVNLHDNLVLVPSGAVGFNFADYYFSKSSGNKFIALTGSSGTGEVYGTAHALTSNLDDANTFESLQYGMNLTASTPTNLTIGKGEQFINNTTNIGFPTGVSLWSNAVRVLFAYYSQQGVTAAASDGGLVRLTVTTTTGLVSGQTEFCELLGGVDTIGVFPIRVIDGTHVDLESTSYSNTLTGECFGIP
jgi:hypothetical protein